MPTVFREGRLRIVIYPADHRPAHVHSIGPDGEAVFNLIVRVGPLPFGKIMESLRAV